MVGLGAPLEHELGEQTEGHLFAMDEGVAGGDGGDAVVYRVGQGQSTAFEAQAREQVFGLHDPLQGWGGGAGFHHGGVHQHEQGMAVVEAKPLHRAASFIHHGERTAGGVGAGTGANNSHRTSSLGKGHQPGDFFTTALATEGEHKGLDAFRRQHAAPDRLQHPERGAARDQDHTPTEPEVLQLTTVNGR